MPSQKKLNAQQQRDKRAKLLLGLLGVVLLAVLGFEVPGMLGGKKSPAAAPATTSASTTTGGTTTAGTLGVAAAAATPASFQVVATPQPGQLTKFSRLHAKDPFHALVAVPAAGSSTGSSTGSSKGSSTTPAKQLATATTTTSVAFSIPKTTTTTAAQSGPLVLAAVLKLNGQRRVIPVGSSFPLVNPVFKLVAIGKGAIWITLVGGSFASGDQTLKIQLKHPIKLVNTTADLDYLIRFVRMMAVHKPLQPVTTATATTTASTTTSTSSTTTAPTTTAP